MIDYREMLCALLDQEPLKSTWFYQDEQIAAIEQAVFERMAFDELFYEDDVVRSLKQAGFAADSDAVAKQMVYMNLGASEERLIFRDVLMALYHVLQQENNQPSAKILAEALSSISDKREPSGKVIRFVDGFVYVPKFVILMLVDHDGDSYTAEQMEKIKRMKPKFAKYFFNCYIEALTEEAALSKDSETKEKRVFYGRIKNE